MSLMSADVKTQAITANLKAVHALLVSAARQSEEAYLASQSGERDRAIGAVYGLDAILDDATMLYAAAIVLHRLK